MIPAVISRNLPGIALVAVLAGGVWTVADAFQDRARLRADLAATRSELATAQASLQQAAETARIHRAHRTRAADEARSWSARSKELQTREGRDAPLSPLLAATARRLFRSGQ